MTATSVAARTIYEEMVLDDSLSAPQDLKQVRNTKHLEQKKKRCKVSKDSNQNQQKNTADDIITLLNNVHDHPFIQAIIQTKGKSPAVILYLKEQIDEIKMFCLSDATHPGVLGVDRTFNLGDSINDSINGIQVGGRNLLVGSDE